MGSGVDEGVIGVFFGFLNVLMRVWGGNVPPVHVAG